MRHWPLSLASLIVIAACTAPSNAPPVQSGPPGAEAPATVPATSQAPASPSPTPTPSASASASASPGASASPSPSPSPTGLSEANHGPQPFPSAPGSNAYDLSTAKVTAGAGATTAIGAIDGKPYTEWSARAGIGQSTTLTIDLGAAKPVSKVELLGDASPTSEVTFDVDTSADALVWKTVARGVMATASNTAPKWGTASFATQQARYVRIVPTRWGSSWVAVWETRVYP